MEQEEEAKHGSDGDDGAGHDEAIVLAVNAFELVDGDGEGKEFRRLKDDLGADEVVPHAEEGNEEEGSDHGTHEGNDEGEKNPKFSSTINACGFEDFIRDGVPDGLAKEIDSEGWCHGGQEEARVAVE